jgi:hypothetical protein
MRSPERAVLVFWGASVGSSFRVTVLSLASLLIWLLGWSLRLLLVGGSSASNGDVRSSGLRLVTALLPTLAPARNETLCDMSSTNEENARHWQFSKPSGSDITQINSYTQTFLPLPALFKRLCWEADWMLSIANDASSIRPQRVPPTHCGVEQRSSKDSRIFTIPLRSLLEERPTRDACSKLWNAFSGY